MLLGADGSKSQQNTQRCGGLESRAACDFEEPLSVTTALATGFRDVVGNRGGSTAKLVETIAVTAWQPQSADALDELDGDVEGVELLVR
jgi:hypothetical protein